MRVNIAQSSPPYSLTPHSCQNTLHSPLRLHRSSSATLSVPKSTVRNHPIRSSTGSFDGLDFPHQRHHFPVDHFTPNPEPFSTKRTSFLRPVDVLEPSLLGIRPDPPIWPARDAVMRECIARRTSSIEIPVSLRMIKMKQKFLKLKEEIDIDIDIGDLSSFVENNPMNNLCSTLYIIREIQSFALKSRGILLDEEFDIGIISKVQREMTCSFVWLFKEVFAKTPDFMLQIMVLTSNFALESLNHLAEEKKLDEGNLGNYGVGHLELGNLGVPTRVILEESEVGLWNSVVEEADQIRGDKVKNQEQELVIDRNVDYDFDDVNEISGLVEQQQKRKNGFEFVSPVKVEIERDDYEEYDRTDLLYQIGLIQDPNTLLLSNYAQFLCLVSRDYDRAEECFKRAIQLDRNDAEIASLYANFLWVIRKDLWGAEERFQQAVAAEPDNSYHASKYASFLWSTGGDETC